MDAILSSVVEGIGREIRNCEASGDRSQGGRVPKVGEGGAARTWQAGHHRADERVSSTGWVTDFGGQ